MNIKINPDIRDFDLCYNKMNELFRNDKKFNNFEFQCIIIRLNLFLNQLKSLIGILSASVSEMQFINMKNLIQKCIGGFYQMPSRL